MCAPLFANLFHRHFRRKESERQASFSFRVTFTILFHAMSGGDIHTFDGFPCKSLCLCDRRCGRGHSGQRFPPSVRTFGLATQGFMICLSLFGLATGIGLLYLRKWARISILIWGGLSVFFGVIGIPIAF